jgi:AcrR family transcriptional regulator
MSRPADFDLDADEIVSAAVEIFRESGLDAVSMRSVASRLGVSPVPLYSRIGNKDALVDAIADRLFANLSPARVDNETWDCYATRWATALRSQLASAKESRLILSLGRGVFAVESGARPPNRPKRVRPGGDAGGIDAAEANALFDIHIRHLIDGIRRDIAAETPTPPARR